MTYFRGFHDGYGIGFRDARCNPCGFGVGFPGAWGGGLGWGRGLGWGGAGLGWGGAGLGWGGAGCGWGGGWC